MFTDLTWQVQVLIGEALLSMMLGMWMIERGYFQRSIYTMMLFVPWDLACIGLLVTGGNLSVQHSIVFWLYVIAVVGGTINSLRRKRVVFEEKIRTSAQFLAGLICLFQVLMLATG